MKNTNIIASELELKTDHTHLVQLMFGEMLLLDFSLALQLLHKGHCIRLAAYFTVKTFLK